MKQKHGLGRGLSALVKDMPDMEVKSAPPPSGQVRVAVEDIERSPLQPRQAFERDGMEDLVRSIAERGVVQPLLVRRKGDKYELIAGERRLRAAREAGREDVPVVVMDVTDQQVLELALIENLQREDLNIVEEAQGYKVLADKFGMTQELIAERVGKARASVANAMRLLELSERILAFLSDGSLSPGHAKVLLGIEIPEEQFLLAAQVVREGISVRNLEKLVDKQRRAPRKPRVTREDIPRDYIGHMVDALQHRLATSVRLASCRTYANGKKAPGRIEIEFYSSEDLTRILDMLGVTGEME